MIDASEFRRVMGHFATGVTVVTTRAEDGDPRGLTANSVCSVSLRPSLVLVCVDHSAETHAHIHRAGVFAINMLDSDRGEGLARRFAAWDTADKFRGIAFREEHTGAPVFDDALGWADCELRQSFDAGDHTVFLGEVVAADAREGTPLLYYRGGYGRFIP